MPTAYSYEEITGYGAVLEYYDYDAGTPDWVAVAGLKDIPFPTFELESVDITSQDSPNQARETIPGFSSLGDVQLEGYFFDTQFATMLTRAMGRKIEDWRIRITQLSTPKQLAWQGWIKTFGGNLPLKEAAMMPFAIENIGVPTYGAVV